MLSFGTRLHTQRGRSLEPRLVLPLGAATFFTLFEMLPMASDFSAGGWVRLQLTSTPSTGLQTCGQTMNRHSTTGTVPSPEPFSAQKLLLD